MKDMVPALYYVPRGQFKNLKEHFPSPEKKQNKVGFSLD
jgi:hypothetical protein